MKVLIVRTLIALSILFFTTNHICGQKNIAQGKRTSQSSTHGALGAAKVAVDGNFSGVWKDKSVTHTKKEANPWWEVDLGQLYDISKIEIFNRTDCCAERLDNIEIYIKKTKNSTGVKFNPNTLRYRKGQMNPLVISSRKTGRYVRIVRKSSTPVYLSLAEVRITGLKSLQLRPDEPVDPITKPATTKNVRVSKKVQKLTLFNSSGCLMRVRIDYVINGRSEYVATNVFAISEFRTLTVPAGVSDIKIKAEYNAVIWKELFNVNQHTELSSTCIKFYGSAFNLKWSEDCNSTPVSNYVTFFNQSGYVARFSVTYTLNGKTQVKRTNDLVIGDRKTISIPANATNIKVIGEGSTVFSWKTIFKKTYKAPPSDCFKVYETIFAPKWNNDCQ